jgi:two-component system response regulator HydG
VPALRERCADILPLAHMLLQQSAARIGKPVRGMTPSAANLLLDYCWPGNVRELENYMERAVALCKLDQITAGDLPPVVHQIRGDDLTIPGWTGEELVTLGEMRLRYVRRVLALAKGNKSLAARILGIDRRTVAQWRTKQAEVVDDETVQSP